MKIENIEQPLRDHIINAALKEFAIHGYERASYNNILREGGISKGRFYQYVKSKKDLYDYLIENGIEKIFSHLDYETLMVEKDVIKRYRQVMLNSVGFYLEYPYYFPFFKSLYNDPAMTQQFVLKYGKISDDFNNVGIDEDLFKVPVDVYKKVKIMKYTSEGILNRYLVLHHHQVEEMKMDEIKNEINDYFDVFRQLYYK